MSIRLFDTHTHFDVPDFDHDRVQLAHQAKAAGVESVVFDRNGYLYHGRVQALADAAREGGLKF